jgi:hypothetical protein
LSFATVTDVSERSGSRWSELGRRTATYFGMRGSRYGRVDQSLDEDVDELRRQLANLRRRVDELERGDPPSGDE